MYTFWLKSSKENTTGESRSKLKDTNKIGTKK